MAGIVNTISEEALTPSQLCLMSIISYLQT